MFSLALDPRTARGLGTPSPACQDATRNLRCLDTVTTESPLWGSLPGAHSPRATHLTPGVHDRVGWREGTSRPRPRGRECVFTGHAVVIGNPPPGGPAQLAPHCAQVSAPLRNGRRLTALNEPLSMNTNKERPLRRHSECACRLQRGESFQTGQKVKFALHKNPTLTFFKGHYNTNRQITD